MNFFQRLTHLKQWHDENHTLYIDNRKILKVAFSKKYHNELKRYTVESKRLKRKRADEITSERSLSYHDWIESKFQKLLQNLSNTRVEFQKKDLLNNFDNWVKDFANLDYKFRIYALELYYKVELARFNSQFDLYIVALKEGQANWLYTEDERYSNWQENHPLYKELQELEYQYDFLEDDETAGQSFTFNKRLDTINDKHKYSKMYKPASRESLTIAVEKPLPVKPHTPSYF